MELLTAVNIILPALGEHPVTRVDRKHPTLAVILPVMDNKIKTALLRGWWFNEYKTTLYPNSEGGIDMPTTTIAFLPDAGFEGSVRNFKLFNLNTSTFTWTDPVPGVIQELLDFEDLPESVALFCLYSSLVEVYLVDIGLENVVGEWKQLAKEAEFSACNEHLRNKRFSTKKSNRYARLRSAMRG